MQETFKKGDRVVTLKERKNHPTGSFGTVNYFGENLSGDKMVVEVAFEDESVAFYDPKELSLVNAEDFL